MTTYATCIVCGDYAQPLDGGPRHDWRECPRLDTVPRPAAQVMFWPARCGCGKSAAVPLLTETTRCDRCGAKIRRADAVPDGDVADTIALILNGHRVPAPPPPGHAPFVMPHDEPVAALLRTHGYLLCPECTGLTIVGQRFRGVDTLNDNAAGPEDGARCRIHIRTAAERHAASRAVLAGDR